jgi:hypothetical protein
VLVVPLALYTPLTLPFTYAKFDEPPPPLFTVSVKLWLAAVPTPLLAVMVKVYVPPLPDAGVPLSVAVPFPLLTKVTPLGNVPVSASVGVGDPVVVTVKLPAAPTVNVVLLALVIAGGACTRMVRVGGLGSVRPALSVTVNVVTYVPGVA